MEKKLIIILVSFIILIIIFIYQTILLKDLENEFFKFQKTSPERMIVYMDDFIKFQNVENGSIVNLTESKEIYKKIYKKEKEVKELTNTYWEVKYEIFKKSLNDSINKSMQIELRTNQSFNELYNKYMVLFLRNFNTNLDDNYEHFEYVQTAQELINNNYAGDCDDYSVFLYTLAKKKNLTVRIVMAKKHFWIQIKKLGLWWDYDSTDNLVCLDCIQNEIITYYPDEIKRFRTNRTSKNLSFIKNSG